MPTAVHDHRIAALKALAHPVRLRIAETLARGPLGVSEIHARTDLDLSTVSRHLTQMREAGWLDCEKSGLHVTYRLACDCLPTLLRCLDALKPSGGCDC